MKTLYESLLDDFDTLANKIDPKDAVKQFLYDNYTGVCVISKKPINGKYEVSGKSEIIELNLLPMDCLYGILLPEILYALVVGILNRLKEHLKK